MRALMFRPRTWESSLSGQLLFTGTLAQPPVEEKSDLSERVNLHLSFGGKRQSP